MEAEAASVPNGESAAGEAATNGVEHHEQEEEKADEEEEEEEEEEDSDDVRLPLINVPFNIVHCFLGY